MNADQNRFDTTLCPRDKLDVTAEDIARHMVAGDRAAAQAKLTAAQKEGLSVSAIVKRAQVRISQLQAR